MAISCSCCARRGYSSPFLVCGSGCRVQGVGFAVPLSNQLGAHKPAKARFLPWLSDKKPLKQFKVSQNRLRVSWS